MREFEIELLNLALDKGIGVTIRRDIYTDVPSFCFPELKKIMVNANCHNYIFQFAHELGHILNGDTSSAKLSFNSHAYNKTEYSAHVTGVKLLVSLYAKKAHELNYVKFMDMFAIPDRMVDVVITELNKKATQY